MSQENMDVVRRLFEGFNTRDTNAIQEIWAADAEWRPAFLGGGLVEDAVYRGHAGMSTFLEIQDETWEGVAADPVAIRDLGDTVLVEVQLNAIGRASGVPVDRTTWNVFELRDGKVAAGCVYTTREQALEAVGLRE
jgi:ketosteroid isomerase-like protein